MLAIVDECGLVLEKELLGQEKHRVEEQAQQEALRANLLRAISHDLRTPLTAISGNAGILMENASVLDAAKRRQLYTSIYDDSMWLANLVENLLSVSRIENGTIRLKMEPGAAGGGVPGGPDPPGPEGQGAHHHRGAA